MAPSCSNHIPLVVTASCSLSLTEKCCSLAQIIPEYIERRSPQWSKPGSHNSSVERYLYSSSCILLCIRRHQHYLQIFLQYVMSHSGFTEGSHSEAFLSRDYHDCRLAVSVCLITYVPEPAQSTALLNYLMGRLFCAQR